jgi:hypothetical protein
MFVVGVRLAVERAILRRREKIFWLIAGFFNQEGRGMAGTKPAMTKGKLHPRGWREPENAEYLLGQTLRMTLSTRVPA